MNEKFITLKTFMQVLAEAAVYAANKLQCDYITDKGKSVNHLRVAGIRVTIDANVLDDKDIFPDFGNPDGSFKGEIIFN